MTPYDWNEAILGGLGLLICSESGNESESPATPSPQLYRHVRAAFVDRGTTFNRWCQGIGVKRENASKALLGTWRGPKARRVLQACLEASGVDLTLHERNSS